MLDWVLITSPGDHIRLGVQHAKSTIYRRFLRKRYKFYKKQVTPMLKILGRSRLNVAHRENYVNILFNFRKKYFLNNLRYNLCFFLCFTINSLDNYQSIMDWSFPTCIYRYHIDGGTRFVTVNWLGLGESKFPDLKFRSKCMNPNYFFVICFLKKLKICSLFWHQI